MLFVTQFPLADIRKFLDGAQLIGPVWPNPTHSPKPDFVRYFGAIRIRNRGGIFGWVGENLICRADRALSLVNVSAPPIKRLVAFKRFYFDGYAVGKYEIGLNIWHYQFQTIEDLANYFLSMPVRVSHIQKDPIDCPLVNAGKHLAILYWKASSPTSSPVLAKGKWHVREGMPLLFLEVEWGDRVVIPEEARELRLPDFASGIQLFHYGVPYKGGKIFLWILRRGADVDKDTVRKLRLYLLRLNAEHECLRLVLHSIEKGDIQVTPGTKAFHNLETYLEKAFDRIGRYEAQTGDINEEIAELARHSINTILPGQLDALMQGVEHHTDYLRQAIEKYAKQDISVKGIYVAGDLTNEGKLEVTVDESTGKIDLSHANVGQINIADKIDSITQNVANIGGMSQASKDELKELFEQLKSALKETPAENSDEAETVANTAQDVVNEISKEKPSKGTLQIKLSGLKMAAENIAKVLPSVLPIATKIIEFVSTTVAKSAGAG